MTTPKRIGKGRPDRYLSPAQRAEREAASKAAQADSARELEERLRNEAPARATAAKQGILATLDNVQVTLDNLRGALEAAHVFNVRAVGDAVRFALSELDRTEARIVSESGLEVVETDGPQA